MNGLQTLAWLTDPWTYLIVALVALLLFGKRLPEVGRSLGKGIAEFKKGLHDVSDEMNREDTKPEPPRQRLQSPEREDERAATGKLTEGEEPRSSSPGERPREGE